MASNLLGAMTKCNRATIIHLVKHAGSLVKLGLFLQLPPRLWWRRRR
eukprot:COSAG06_NODE_12192_length_1411_cov_2.179116_3_plen_46_part_01